MLLKSRFGYDDALDAFGVHGVGGALGAILTGVFAAKAFNPAGADGLIHGQVGPLVTQLIGLAAAGAFAAGVTFVVLKAIDATVGLRVDKETEREGLDEILHGESGYTLGSTGASAAFAETPAPAAAPEAAPAVARLHTSHS